MKYEDRQKTSQTFILTGIENRGKLDDDENVLKGSSGLLAVWGEPGVNMQHINDLDNNIKLTGFYNN